MALHRRTQTLQLISALPGNYTADNEPQIYTKIRQDSERLTRELIQLLETSFWAGFVVDLETRSLRLHAPPASSNPGSDGSILDEITAPMSVALSIALQHHLGVAEPKIDAIAAKLIPFIDLIIVEPSKSTSIPVLKAEKKGNDIVLMLRSNEPQTSNLSSVVQGLANATQFFQYLTDHLINPILAERARLEALISITRNPETRPIESLCTQLGSILLPYVVDRLVKCCFETSIPEHRSQLEAYQRSVSVEVDRFVPILSKFSWLHTEQESPAISITDSTNELSTASPEPSIGWASISKFIEFLKNSQLHFAIKKRHTSLAYVRELLLSGSYTSRLVGEMEFETSAPSPTSPDALMAAPLFRFPRCKVRDVIVDIVNLAQSLVSDAFNEPTEEPVSLAVPSTPSSRFNRSQIQKILLETAKDIFDIYRAIVPSLERHRIANIPSLSMLFHNDCQYMAHHATLLGAQCRLNLRFGEANDFEIQSPTPLSITPPPSRGSTLNPSHASQNFLRSASESLSPELAAQPIFSLAELVPTFRHMAESFYLDIFTAVREHTMLFLERMDGLKRTDDEQKKQKCLTAARHIHSELESRDLMWSETLPVELHKVTMGRLLNEVVEWMLERVLQFRDFSEEETISLNLIFKSLFPLARIFVNVNDSIGEANGAEIANGKKELDSITLTRQSCAKYVKSWLKFEDLADAFDMRMVEIVERFNAGDFHFSRNQTISIIQALFQESEKRVDCIAALRTDLPW